MPNADANWDSGLDLSKSKNRSTAITVINNHSVDRDTTPSAMTTPPRNSQQFAAWGVGIEKHHLGDETKIAPLSQYIKQMRDDISSQKRGEPRKQIIDNDLAPLKHQFMSQIASKDNSY